MKKKIIATVVTACTLMSMTACTSTGTGNSVTGNSESQTEVSDSNVSSAEDSSDTTAAGSDETNAGFAYTGTYYGDRCQMILESDGQSKVKIKARWAGSAKEFSEWTMTGDYDKETNMITYTDGVKKDVTYSDETTIDKENTVYSDGTGTLIFSTSGESFTWTDKKENAADGLIFRIYKDETEASGSAPSDGASDENYYIAFSAMSKSGIEENADKIRKLYLAEDWEGMKTMIRYPVMINGASVENEEEYLKVMKGKKISEDSRKAMEAETCKNMFFNGQGLCLGSGQVWLLDPSYMTENTPEIKIKTIQGIG
jgi:hypothetical protein